MAIHVITEERRTVCEIVVDAGLLTSPGLPRWLHGSDRAHQRIALLAQPGSLRQAEGVAAACAGDGVETAIRVLPDREDAKRLSVVEEVCLWLNDRGMTRGDLIVGVGGGALTDVVGFIAATYLRGLEVVLMPTTLLGAVDAAIGGKSGVNVGGKNLAGVFRHPGRVLIDPETLASLPLDLIREGSAEAVKAGLIGDPALVELYERHGIEAPLGEVVERAVAVKVDIVRDDFTETGRRGWLNYGHTVGHAIEMAAGISHGDAVAVGMVAAATASERLLGYEAADRQREVMERLGLPTAAPEVARDEAIRLMWLDKKRDRSGLRMTLLRHIGDPVVAPVDDATVDAALAAVGIT